MLSSKNNRPLMFADWEKLFKPGAMSPHEILQDFYSFEKIPGVQESFNRWSLDVQHQVIRWFRQDMDLRSISIIVKLRSEAESAHPKHDWSQSSLTKLSEIAKQSNPAITPEYISLIDEFAEFQSDRSLFDYTFIREMNITALYLMSVIYPLELVTEVMECWMKNTVSQQLYQFAELLELWDELKAYPIDWTVLALD